MAGTLVFLEGFMFSGRGIVLLLRTCLLSICVEKYSSAVVQSLFIILRSNERGDISDVWSCMLWIDASFLLLGNVCCVVETKRNLALAMDFHIIGLCLALPNLRLMMYTCIEMLTI